jgi:enamine deaminase RidA (YjgF/YER057c/UK114 family)
MAKTFELMEEHMPAPSGNKSSTPSSRLRDLGIVLPSPPTPLGTYMQASEAGNLLFLSGTVPVVNRKLAGSGRLGENLSVKDGQKAVRIASLNALAAAKEHLGDLDRLKKLESVCANWVRRFKRTLRKRKPSASAVMPTIGAGSPRRSKSGWAAGWQRS